MTASSAVLIIYTYSSLCLCLSVSCNGTQTCHFIVPLCFSLFLCAIAADVYMRFCLSAFISHSLNFHLLTTTTLWFWHLNTFLSLHDAYVCVCVCMYTYKRKWTSHMCTGWRFLLNFFLSLFLFLVGRLSAVSNTRSNEGYLSLNKYSLVAFWEKEKKNIGYTRNQTIVSFSSLVYFSLH